MRRSSADLLEMHYIFSCFAYFQGALVSSSIVIKPKSDLRKRNEVEYCCRCLGRV